MDDADVNARWRAMTRRGLHATPDSAQMPDGHYGDGLEDVAACRVCGLCLLDLFISSSNWVKRRSEQVSFIDDRTVHRRVSVDFQVPPGPRLLQPDGAEVRVMPLALLRRRTLVNFDLRDEDNRALQLPQLRQNQALTKCLIRAWAEESYRRARGETIDFTAPITVDLDPGVPYEHGGARTIRTVGDWLDGLADGDQRKLHESYEALQRGHGPLRLLRQDPCFMTVVDRLADSFLLLLFLVDAPVGSNRLVKYSYDERLSWRYRKSGFRYEDGDRAAYSETESPLRLRDELRYRLGAAAGLTPTVVRFPVPAAEHTASYHFELEAPPGVLIESAALVAGRPNGNPDEPRVDPDAPPADATRAQVRDRALEDAAHRFAVDHVVGAQPRVNLHVVDVPFGSLSRAQANLIVDPRGWLGAMTAAVAATTLVIAWAALTYSSSKDANLAETVVVTLVAAVGAILAQPDPHRMVTRLLAILRAAALGSTACAVLAGAAMAFNSSTEGTRWLLRVLAATSLAITAVLATVHARATRTMNRDEQSWTQDRPGRERGAGARRWWRVPGRPAHPVYPNRWEQSKEKAPPCYPVDDMRRRKSLFDYFNTLHGMDRPSIRVASSESSRRNFAWTEDFEVEFKERLSRARSHPVNGGRNPP